jgi:hypothetical protein
MPKFWRSPEIMPNWPLYIQPHMKMPMAMGTTHGGMVRMRKIVWPGIAALRSTAPQVPMIIFIETEKKVQMKVRTITSLKLPAPKMRS